MVMDKPVYLASCGRTAQYFNEHPDVADELVKAVQMHVDRNPELKAQLQRQERRWNELGIGRNRDG